MDIEKLIEDLHGILKQYGEKIPYGELVGAPWPYSRAGDLVWPDPEPYFIEQAATALSTLQAENEEMQKKLNEFSEFLCHMTGGLLSKTNYTAQEMVTAAEDYQQKVCGECDLRDENEKRRVEAEGMRSNWYKSVEEIKKLRAELEQVKRELEAAAERIREWEKFDTYLFVHNFITPEKWRGQKED